MEATASTEITELSSSITIINRLGLHARAAAKLVQLAETFESEILLEKDGVKVEADSVLSLLTLECPMGTTVTIHASGRDSETALAAVTKLIEDKFGEE